MDLTNTKSIETELQEDGTVRHHIVSRYGDVITDDEVQLEKHVSTSRNTLLKDLISCLEIDKSVELYVRYRRGQPSEIVKRWTVSKEVFNRR